MSETNDTDRFVIKIMNRVEWLIEKRFFNPVKFLKSFPKMGTCKEEDILRVIDFLQKNGSKNPVRVIQGAPGIIHLQDELLHGKLILFRDIGFLNPMAMIDDCPSFITYSVEKVFRRIEEMHNRGFSDPLSVIEGNPSLCGYKIETIDLFLSALKDRGFDPIYLMEKAPFIIKASIETIDEKIKVFSDSGISDPISFCQKYPMILEYSSLKISSQIKILKEATNRWYELVSGAPLTLRYGEATLRIVLGIMTEHLGRNDIPKTSLYTDLFYVNTGKLAYAHYILKTGSLEGVLREAKNLTLSKEEVSKALRKTGIANAVLAAR